MKKSYIKPEIELHISILEATPLAGTIVLTGVSGNWQDKGPIDEEEVDDQASKRFNLWESWDD